MKKLVKFLPALMLIAVIAISIPGPAPAQTWHTANQITVAWDPVTTNENGDAIDPAEISYVVYVCNAVTDPNHQNPSEIGPTNDTQYLLTLGVEGKFFFGIKAMRTVEGEIVGESRIVWSNEPEYDFGLQHFLAPADPAGLKLPQ